MPTVEESRARIVQLLRGRGWVPACQLGPLLTQSADLTRSQGQRDVRALVKVGALQRRPSALPNKWGGLQWEFAAGPWGRCCECGRREVLIVTSVYQDALCPEEEQARDEATQSGLWYAYEDDVGTCAGCGARYVVQVTWEDATLLQEEPE
jgi:hypothetical protein